MSFIPDSQSPFPWHDAPATDTPLDTETLTKSELALIAYVQRELQSYDGYIQQRVPTLSGGQVGGDLSGPLSSPTVVAIGGRVPMTESTPLGGDLSGTLPNPQVVTVGGQTGPLIQPGFLVAWPSATPPAGYLAAGATFSAQTYPQLFAANGNSTTLPNPTPPTGCHYYFYAGTSVVALPTNTAAPSIAGTTLAGNILTASPGTWTGAPTFAYQWLRSVSAGPYTAIPGATSQTYTLQTIDIGTTLEVQLTATNTGGSAVATSAATATITGGTGSAPTNTVAPSITGTAQVGQTLTANDGTWTQSPTFTHQWLRSTGGTGTTSFDNSGSLGYINSANPSFSHTINTGVTNGMLLVWVQAWNSTTAPTSVKYGGTAMTQIASVVDSTNNTALFCYALATGSTTGTASVAISWAVATQTEAVAESFSGAAQSIGGLTTNAPAAFSVSPQTVTLANPTNGLVASALAYVYGSGVGGAATSTTATPDQTQNPTAQRIGVACLHTTSGTVQWAESGGTMHSFDVISVGVPPASTAGGFAAISGATASTYVPAAADVGFTLEVQVTGTNTAGSVQATSAATGAVASGGAAPANSVAPSISGSAVQGGTLTVANGTWSGSPTFTYQWFDNPPSGNPTAIAGATASTYVLQVSDVGDTITCIVTATNVSGTTTASAAPTATVQATTSASSGNFVPYAATSPWNIPVPAGQPVDPNSAAYIASLNINSTDPNHPTFGDDPTQFTLPVYIIATGQANLNVKVSGAWKLATGPAGKTGTITTNTTISVPIPPTAQPAGPGAGPDTGDNQVIVWNPVTGDEYGFFHFANPGNNGSAMVAENAYYYNTNWDAVPGTVAGGTLGPRGGGVPYLAGLIRPWEIEQGHIDHAIAWAYQVPSPNFVYPATHSDGSTTSLSGALPIPEGTWIQLDPTQNPTVAWGLVQGSVGWMIAKAFQKYGGYIIDNAGHPKIYAEYQGTANWGVGSVPVLGTRDLAPIPFTAFRVLQHP